MPGVQIRAAERWLDEGWSPWRIGYGVANLIALTVTVYIYARQFHHPGAIWWLTAAVAVVALWALGEMLRWRIKYRRLLSAQQASSSEPPPQPISRLLAGGKELRANIGNHMAWWGANRLLPSGVPGRIVRWEGSVSEALTNQPLVRALFQNTPDVDVSRPISGRAYGRLEHQLRVLESATSDDMGDSESDSDRSAAARAEATLAAYYAERVKRLRGLHEQGTELQSVTNSSGDRDVEIGSDPLRDIQDWEAQVGNALMYWPDLNRFGSIITLGLVPAPSVGEMCNRVGQELEALQTAIQRLQGLIGS